MTTSSALMAWYRSATIWFCRRWFMIDSRLGLQMKATDNSSMQRGLFSCRRVFMLPLLKKVMLLFGAYFFTFFMSFSVFYLLWLPNIITLQLQGTGQGGKGLTLLATHYFRRVYFQPFLHCYFQGFWLNYPVKIQIKV